MHFLRFSFLLFAAPFCASAQQPFVEGNIRYAVSLTTAAAPDRFASYTGTYTITVKGSRVRRDLQMAPGFGNIIIADADAGTGFSLQETRDHKYAIQLSTAQLQDQSKRYENFELKQAGEAKTVDDKSCQPFTAQYVDGTAAGLCLSSEWALENPAVFEHFPGLKSIPLRYEYTTPEGARLSFAAEQISAEAVEDGLFRVPPDYKVVSQPTPRNSRN